MLPSEMSRLSVLRISSLSVSWVQGHRSGLAGKHQNWWFPAKKTKSFAEYF